MYINGSFGATVVLFFSIISLIIGFIIGYWWASRDINP